MKNYIKTFENYIKENIGDSNQPRRSYCVVWSTQMDDLGRKGDLVDHSIFYEIGQESKAKEFYDSLLLSDDVYCASLCKVLEDTEG